MRALIIDDEPRARKTILQIIRLYTPSIQVVGEANSVTSAVEAIQQHQPDLLLLDIQLKDGNGFDILAKTKETPLHVIFITAFNEYALNAFKVAAIDYILKPVDPEDFVQAITKVKQQVAHEKLEERIELFWQRMEAKRPALQKITLKTMDSIYVIRVEEIVYCQGEGNYTTFNLSNQREIVVSKNLREYEELLPKQQFLRTHQSFLINLEHISRYDKIKQMVLMGQSNTSVPVSTRKRESLLRFLKDLGV